LGCLWIPATFHSDRIFGLLKSIPYIFWRFYRNPQDIQMVWALALLKSFIFGQMNEMNLERDLQMQLMELPEHEADRMRGWREPWGHFSVQNE